MKKSSYSEKQQFSKLFVVAIVLLMTLPLFITSQDLITKILSLTGISQLIQNYIIPIEVKFVVALLSIFGIPAAGGTSIIVLGGVNNEVFRAQIIWSCIGWQSVVLMVVTLITGLRGRYSWNSKIEILVIGFLGTFWINIFRITIIYILGYKFGQLPVFIFHNFAGTPIVIIWLFFFWWFAYSFVLETKPQDQDT